MIRVPEQDGPFRLARLALLLAVLDETHPDGVDAERLGIYDFLAANPLLVAHADDDPDRLALQLAGFDDRALSYASPAQRYVTAQLHLPADLARLVADGLVSRVAAGRIRYRLTDRGHELAGRFEARYAHAYTVAARLVVGRLRRLSARRLRENLRGWLTAPTGTPPGRLDAATVVEPYHEATAPTLARRRTGFPEDGT
jgi:hypothetical protein